MVALVVIRDEEIVKNQEQLVLDHLIGEVKMLTSHGVPVMVLCLDVKSLSPPTGAVCVRDRLTSRFCQTLLWLGRCQLPNIRAQCCKTCSQAPSSRSASPH